MKNNTSTILFLTKAYPPAPRDRVATSGEKPDMERSDIGIVIIDSD
jgi:hypothetical protein